MKIAVFGGSGSIGYDFVRLVLESGLITPVVYTSAPSSLTNIARHDVDIRYVPYQLVSTLSLDANTQYIINFSHPFQVRDGLTRSEQIKSLAGVFERSLKSNEDVRLIHISSMSVYEPFAQGVEFAEDCVLNPPKGDRYATSKLEFEEALQRLPQAQSRLLILRPTVVFGPYCRPWTDNIMAAFGSGDVAYNSMGGFIQPLYVRDLTNFLLKRTGDFSAGVFNMAGSERISWLSFFEFFADIVRSGRLVRCAPEDTELKDPRIIDDMKSIASLLLKDPSFRRLSNRVRRLVPDQLKVRLIGRMETADVGNNEDKRFINTTYCRPFFGQDRLVSMTRFNMKYGGAEFTDMSTTRDIFADYFSYRFTDRIF